MYVSQVHVYMHAAIYHDYRNILLQ